MVGVCVEGGCGNGMRRRGGGNVRLVFVGQMCLVAVICIVYNNF